MIDYQPIIDGVYRDGFYCMEHFLQQGDYQALQTRLQEQYKSGDFKQASIGNKHQRTLNTAIRNDQICWLDNEVDHQGLAVYFAAMETLRVAFNRALFLGLVDYEAHFSIYLPKSFYKKHVDQFLTTKHRRISCVYYLNNEWQPAYGGELILYDNAGQPLTTIRPQGNCFVCFRSDIPHEVSMTHQVRYSITAWLKSRSSGF